MPEAVLPIFLNGCKPINDLVSYEYRDSSVYYFCGSFPIFSHAKKDRASFKLITSQLIANGQCRNIDIQTAFGVSKVSVCRDLKRFKEGGSAAFFAPKKTRGGSIMTPEVIAEAQELLNQGLSRADAAAKLGILKDTLRKAIDAGKLSEPLKKTTP